MEIWDFKEGENKKNLYSCLVSSVINFSETTYTPEELIGMILEKAKEYAETYTENPIHDAVITVPVYFNQAERRALTRAVEYAGLKLLTLMNDNTAGG